ncbi:hypothetical protein LI018_11515 [Enterocloster bolteae]|nr:hypothetical protein [Enterocloster bolteae]
MDRNRRWKGGLAILAVFSIFPTGAISPVTAALSFPLYSLIGSMLSVLSIFSITVFWCAEFISVQPENPYVKIGARYFTRWFNR